MRNSFPKYVQRNLYYNFFDVFFLFIKLFLSGQIVHGKQTASFCTFLQEKYRCIVLPTGSGRLAITLFLRAMQKRGECNNVLLPFYICPSVPDAVVAAGFRPVFLPIRNDLTLDPDSITEDACARAAAIIIPHPYGYPASIDILVERIRSFNPDIAILDDAAAGYNVSYRGQLLGTFGDAGVLSFSQGKLLNATGGGALLLFNQSMKADVVRQYEQLPSISARDKTREFFRVLWRFGCHRFSDPLMYWFGKVYPHKDSFSMPLGKMSNLDAAVAMASLPKLASVHARRSAIIRRYVAAFSGRQDIVLPQELIDGIPPVNRFYISIPSCRLVLGEHANIVQHNPLYLFLRQQGVKAYYPYLPVKRFVSDYGQYWNEASWLYSLVGLPVDFKRAPHQHDYVIEQVLSFVERL
ncbi:MAG: DegT/DnrJ/EryC1/StrS family aminotransferase [Desulfobulbus sp.]|jgi:dTDP-4-amino-4,6-dideoxygalactose transaminase